MEASESGPLPARPDLVIITGLSGSGANYTIIVSPQVKGAVNVQYAANQVTGATGQGNYPSNPLTVSFDPLNQFLSTWLPVEERRRWRRPAPKAADVPQGHLEKLKRFLDRWLNDEPEPATRVLRTRASDATPTLNFDEPEPAPQKQSARARELVRDDST